MQILNQHPDLLKKPEARVLVEKMTPTTANLRIYYWSNGVKHNQQSVRSSILRLIKRAFHDAKLLNLPGPGEIVFPREIPIRLVNREESSRNGGNGHSVIAPTLKVSTVKSPKGSQRPQPVRTATEKSTNEAEQIQEQAEQSRTVESEVNLLNKTEATTNAEN